MAIIKNIIKGLSKFLNRKSFLFLLFFVTLLFFCPEPAKADAQDVVNQIMGWTAALFARIVYWAMGLTISGIINIASVNDFVNNKGVIDVWKIVRDFCNMGFILVLLVISFATILRIESYNMKQWLPKLILMAILINFSRTICGLLIDVSQIVALTFISTLQAGGEGAIVDYFGIQNMIEAYRGEPIGGVAGGVGSMTLADATAGYIFAVLFMIIAMIVLLAVLVVFLMRMIMFYILTAISPIAFLMMSFPGGRKYASQYWGEFTKYLINGPVLAFFVWMALVTVNSIASNVTAFSQVEMGVTKGTNSGQFASFVIAVGFLVGGLMMSSQIGGMGASWGMSKVNEYKGKGLALGKKGIDKGVDLGKRGAAATVKTTGRVALATAKTMDRGLGSVVRKVPGMSGVTGGLVATGYQKVKNIPSAIKDKVRGNTELKGSLHAYTNGLERLKNSDAGPEDIANHTMKYKNTDYVEKDGKFVEKGNENNVLKDRPDGSAVAPWSNSRAAMHEIWSGVFSKSQAVANKTTEKKVDEKQGDLKAAGESSDMLFQKMDDSASTVIEKMAAALQLAVQGGFKNLVEVEKARKTFGTNQELLGKFNDEVDKKQAYKAYDLADENSSSYKEFFKRLEKGKIDTAAGPADAYKDEHYLNALEKHHGDRFGRVMDKVFERGNKYKENVSVGLKARIDEKNIGEDKNAQLLAGLTGDLRRAFADNGGKINQDALTDFLRKSTAKEANKIDVKQLVELRTDQATQGSTNRAIIKGMSKSKLKQMHRQGDNPELVAEIKKIMSQANHRDMDKINADDDLSTI